MEKKVFFMDCGQELKSFTLEVDEKEQVARIIRVRDETLTPIYQDHFVDINTMVVGSLLGVRAYGDDYQPCIDLIKFPIERIEELPEPKPVICFALKQVEHVVNTFFPDDYEKPANYIKENDYPVVIYDKYLSGEWNWDRETAYKDGIYGKYISYEEFSKQLNK